MWLNGNYWQCPQGHLVPRSGYVPEGAVLLPIIAVR
jgi:hypothetical protein